MRECEHTAKCTHCGTLVHITQVNKANVCTTCSTYADSDDLVMHELSCYKLEPIDLPDDGWDL